MPLDDEVATLFHEVAKLSPAERAAFFEQRQTPEAVRAEVESLLDFDEGPSMTSVLGGVAADWVAARDSAHLGLRCGPYKLVRLLGRGGSGTVFLADRTDGVVEQRVAIKLLRPAADRPAFRERFQRERQILASLQHPGIAHLVDAGETAEGHPYLAMEFIDGVAIDTFAAPLDWRARLNLFLRVCSAVAYAHRNLIVHRDLKPSNILVDGAGDPKLLDFGIAKLLDESTDQTRTHERSLTPDFASPEQVRGAAQTTAVDIYALGAVLYKLVTGRSPHVFPEGNSEAIEVAICTLEPSPATSLNPALPKDLDFILAKALRKEPEERYSSADAFADDIRALLEWRPVRARSGNAWYRARKFARRYWIPVTAATLTAAGLSIGLYVANRERIRAERRFGQLHQLSSKVFELDSDLRRLPGSTQARQRLISTSLAYLEGLRADAPADLDLAQELAASYQRVAQIQGVPNWNNLGQFGEAEKNLKKADTLIGMVLRARPRSYLALLISAEIEHDRMILANSERRDADALAYAGKAADHLERVVAIGGTSNSERVLVAVFFADIGLAHMNMHRFDDAVRYARRSIEVAPAIPEAQKVRGSALGVVANSLRSKGDLDGALEAAHQAREASEHAVYGNETERSLDLYAVLLREGRILGEDGGINLDRPDDAIVDFREAVRITGKAAEEDPNDQNSRSRLGLCARSLGDILRHRNPQQALEVYDLAIRRLGEVQNNIRAERDLATTLANSSYALLRLHRANEAKQRIDAAFAILRKTKDYPAEKIGLESEACATLGALSDLQANQGDLRRAIETAEERLKLVMVAKPDPLADLRVATSLSEIYLGAANLYRKAGDTAQADGMQAKRLELWHYWDQKLPRNAFVARQLAMQP